jgi:hypothetical protein
VKIYTQNLYAGKIIAAVSLYAVTLDAKNLKDLKELYKINNDKDERFLIVVAWEILRDKSKPIFRFAVDGKDPKAREIALKLLKDGHL